MDKSAIKLAYKIHKFTQWCDERKILYTWNDAKLEVHAVMGSVRFTSIEETEIFQHGYIQGQRDANDRWHDIRSGSQFKPTEPKEPAQPAPEQSHSSESRRSK